jgi:dissimilatory sulfite reductase (desulfoviridin) alpha/beta subunit
MKKINPETQPGLAALKKEAPGVVEDMGYMKAGGEKLLAKLTYGGGIDMSEKFVQAMRNGAEKYGYGKEKMKLGGQSGRSTYSGPKKRKK